MADVIKNRLLLVDDDDNLREILCAILDARGFEVRCAGNVKDALKFILEERFDVVVSDLHMPNEGDGLTVVSAMRHANPEVINVIFSAHPDMKRAAAAILEQTDVILLKPDSVMKLADVIREKLEPGAVRRPPPITDIAEILEEETEATIKDWLVRVDGEPKVFSVALDEASRCAHLPQMFGDLVTRLRHPLPLGTRALVSAAASLHGLLRRQQGYTAAMMVEESRMLQVSIFQTLQSNLDRVNFSVVLVAVMAIADECDSQLAQAMTSYVAESQVDALLPVVADSPEPIGAN